MTARSEHLHWPATIEQASTLLRAHGDGVAMAGGQFAVPRWQVHGMPACVVGLGRIEGACRIEWKGEDIWLGAGCTHAQVHASTLLRERIPALSEMAGHIGDRCLRSRGTLGGALMTTADSGCWPAALIGLGATIVTNVRSIEAARWFVRPFGHPVLERGELIVGVRLSVPSRACHRPLRLTPARPALVTVFASIAGRTARIGVSGLSDCAFRATAAEHWLMSGGTDDAPPMPPWPEPARDDAWAPGRYRHAQACRLLREVRQTLRSP